MMPWFKVDDKLHSHKKVAKAGEAMALWVIAGSWAMDQLTDGFVPDYMVGRLMPGGDGMAQTLVDAGLWIEDDHEGDDGWRFVDWGDYQPTRDDVEAKRDVTRRRWAMNNDPELRKAVRGRDGDNCRYCSKVVDWSDRRSPNGGTYDHVVPISKGGDESAENIVVCCRDCNGRKGAQTPDEVGWPLLPSRSNLGSVQKPSRSSPDSSVPPDPARPVPKDQTQGDTSPEDDATDPKAEAKQQFEDHFWPTYPATNGIKRDKQGALKQWLKLSLEDRRNAVRGAKNKAAHFEATGEQPPYAVRFLRNRDFDDYQKQHTSAGAGPSVHESEFIGGVRAG